jgi:hypothetical protein
MIRCNPPIPHIIHRHAENTRGAGCYTIDINPDADGKGYPCFMRDWVAAAVFIQGLQRGEIRRECFTGFPSE